MIKLNLKSCINGVLVGSLLIVSGISLISNVFLSIQVIQLKEELELLKINSDVLERSSLESDSIPVDNYSTAGKYMGIAILVIGSYFLASYFLGSGSLNQDAAFLIDYASNSWHNLWSAHQVHVDKTCSSNENFEIVTKPLDYGYNHLQDLASKFSFFHNLEKKASTVVDFLFKIIKPK